MIEKIPPLEYLWFHVHALTRENVKYTYTYIYLYIKEHSNKEVQNFTQPEMNFNEKGPSYLQLQNSRGLVTGSTSCEGPERQAYHQETAGTGKEGGFITSYPYTDQRIHHFITLHRPTDIKRQHTQSSWKKSHKCTPTDRQKLAITVHHLSMLLLGDLSIR